MKLAFCFLCLTLQLLILILSHFDQDTCGPGLSSRDIDLSSSYRPAVSHDLWPHGVKPAAVWVLPPPCSLLFSSSTASTWLLSLLLRRIALCSGYSWDFNVVKASPSLGLMNFGDYFFSSNGESAGFFYKSHKKKALTPSLWDVVSLSIILQMLGGKFLCLSHCLFLNSLASFHSLVMIHGVLIVLLRGEMWVGCVEGACDRALGNIHHVSLCKDCCFKTANSTYLPCLSDLSALLLSFPLCASVGSQLRKTLNRVLDNMFYRAQAHMSTFHQQNWLCLIALPFGATCPLVLD